MGLAVMLLCSAENASAQPMHAAPTIDRERVDRREPSFPAPSTQPTVPRPVTVEAPPAQETSLRRIRYEGASLPTETLDRVVAPFLGKPLTRETLQRVANAISAAYAKSDVAFYSVTVPQQAISGGELMVRVLEGRVANYAIRRETPSTPVALIHSQLDRLMRDRPTHKPQLERTLSLLRDIPGQTIDAQLRTTGQPGELLLDLDVKRNQVEVALTVNNEGVTNVISGVQAQISVAVHGALREGDSTRAATYLPFQPDRYQFYSLSHTTPLNADGTTLALSGAHVRTRTRDTDVRGTATQAGIAISHPLIRSYRRNLSLGLSLDGINSENYFLDSAFGGFRTRVLRLSSNWSSIETKSGYAVAGTLSQGLDALGARAFEGYSERGFAKANLQLTGVSELGRRTAAKLTLRGQYSRDRLPTTERFALGGEGAGLAFRLGEITADRAIAGSAELSRKVLGSGRAKNATEFTIFAYADAALAHSAARPRFSLPRRDYSLATAGAGVRVSLSKWTASAQVAVPVKRPADYLTRRARVLFSISRAV